MNASVDGFTVISSDVGVPVTVIVKLAEVRLVPASVAVNVKAKAPGVVGVPAIENERSLFRTTARPGGRAPTETRNEG